MSSSLSRSAKSGCYTSCLFLLCCVAMLPTMLVLAKADTLTEDRPAMAFCDTDSSELPKLIQIGAASFQSMNPGSEANSITLTDLNISIAILKIREIELKNIQNFYVSESSLTCNDMEMKVNITLGIRDPEVILKDKPGTAGILVVTMSQFELFVVAILPRRETRIIVSDVTVTELNDLKVEAKPGAPLSTEVINSFLKNIPKKVLMSMMARHLTKAAQVFLDKYSVGI